MARSREKTTIWNLVFNYLAALYAIISGIILVPLYLRYIPLELYGAWLATGNVVTWIAIVDPGVSPVLAQKVSAAYGRGDNRLLSGLFTNGFVISVFVALAILIAGISASSFVPSLVGISEREGQAVVSDSFRVAIVSTALMIIAAGITALNQGIQSSLGIGLIFAITNLASLVLTVVLLVVGEFGLMAIPVAMLFRAACLTIANLAYLFWRVLSERMEIRWSFEGFGELTRLMSFTFGGRTAHTIASNIDAFLVARYLGPEIAPILVLTRKAPDVSRMFLERPAVAFMPSIASLYSTGDLERVRIVLLRLTRIILWLIGLAVVGFSILNEAFVNLLAGKSFYAGTSVNIVIVMELVILVFMSTLSNLCYAMGNIKGNSVAMVAQSVVQIPLMIFGVLHFGILGVVAAPLLAILVTTAWYIPRAFSRMLSLSVDDYRTLRDEMVAVCGSLLVTLLTMMWLEPSTWWSFVAAVAAVAGAYVGYLSYFSREFRREVGSLIGYRTVK